MDSDDDIMIGISEMETDFDVANADFADPNTLKLLITQLKLNLVDLKVAQKLQSTNLMLYIDQLKKNYTALKVEVDYLKAEKNVDKSDSRQQNNSLDDNFSNVERNNDSASKSLHKSPKANRTITQPSGKIDCQLPNKQMINTVSIETGKIILSPNISSLPPTIAPDSRKKNVNQKNSELNSLTVLNGSTNSSSSDMSNSRNVSVAETTPSGNSEIKNKPLSNGEETNKSAVQQADSTCKTNHCSNINGNEHLCEGTSYSIRVLDFARDARDNELTKGSIHINDNLQTNVANSVKVSSSTPTKDDESLSGSTSYTSDTDINTLASTSNSTVVTVHNSHYHNAPTSLSGVIPNINQSRSTNPLASTSSSHSSNKKTANSHQLKVMINNNLKTLRQSPQKPPKNLSVITINKSPVLKPQTNSDGIPILSVSKPVLTDNIPLPSHPSIPESALILENDHQTDNPKEIIAVKDLRRRHISRPCIKNTPNFKNKIHNTPQSTRLTYAKLLNSYFQLSNNGKNSGQIFIRTERKQLTNKPTVTVREHMRMEADEEEQILPMEHEDDVVIVEQDVQPITID